MVVRMNAASCLGLQSKRVVLDLVCSVTVRCLVAAIFIGVAACTVAAQDGPSRFLVDDGSPPMSAVIGYAEIGQNKAIAVDNNAGLFLIESDRRTKKIGLAGDGPCAIRRVGSFTVVQDTLFVLDNRQGRIIGYLISTGECVAEIVNPELAEVNSLSRVGGWFYLVATGYSSVSPENQSLLYRLHAASSFEPLPLAVKDLESNMLLAPIRVGRRTSQIRVKDKVLYFLLPFSHRLWRYDTQTAELSSIRLLNDSPDISAHTQTADFEIVGEVISQLESELDLFLLDDYIAVMSNYKSQWRLGLYSYDGEVMAKGEVSRHVNFASGGRFYSLKETGSEPELYAFLEVVPPGR